MNESRNLHLQWLPSDSKQTASLAQRNFQTSKKKSHFMKAEKKKVTYYQSISLLDAEGRFRNADKG